MLDLSSVVDEYHSIFNQPIVEQKWSISLKPAILPVLTSILLLFLSAISLPSSSRSAVFFRLFLLPFQLLLAYDICTNKQYSLGSAFRDCAFPSFAFLILFRSIDFSFLNLWDSQPAFHWIVPDIPESNNNPASTSVTELSKPIRWKKVPHPPLFSFARILWALDNLTLMRPGTSFIFPWRLRALEWSQRALESPNSKFGVPEWPLLPAIIQQLVHLACHLYLRHINLKAGQSLFDQPLLVQCALTFALGGVVTFSYALEEAIFFPLILRFNLLPETALTAHSNRAITSAGIGDLWSKRWHHIWKRCFVRLARLVPGSSYRIIQMFSAFWISAILHCFILARSYPTPDPSRPMTFLPLIYEPGIYQFFLCQGIAVIIEKMILGDFKQGEGIMKRIIRIVWLYFALLGAGRYSANSLALKGYLDKSQWEKITLPAIAKIFLVDMFGK